MIYVTYDLKWSGKNMEIGDQPYIAVKECDADFDGGYLVKDGTYFGYIYGTDENCGKAVEICGVDYKMKELTKEEALIFYEETIPLNTEIKVSIDNEIKVVSNYIIKEDGKIEQVLSNI